MTVEVVGRSTTSTVDPWRDRALEAEARLAAVEGLARALLLELLGDADTATRLQRILEAPSPTVTVGQTWEIVEGESRRQAVIVGPDVATARPHQRGARYWRIRSQRSSTIREDVLRRRWTLLERAEAQA